MSKVIQFIGSFALVASTVVAAQSSLELEQMAFTAELESRLNNDIERVIGPNRHVLVVEAELVREPIGVPEQALAPQQPKPVASTKVNDERLPELPGLSGIATADALEVVEQDLDDTQVNQEELPLQEQPTAPAMEKKIRSISTILQLDTSIAQDKVELVRSVALKKLQYNALRGDKFTLIQTDLEIADQNFAGAKSWQDYWWVVIVAIALLIALWGVMKAKRAVKEDAPVIDMSPSAPQALLDAKKGELKEIRQKLVKYSLSEPKKVNDALSRLSLNEQNTPVFASAYQELGRALFTSVFPVLNKQIPTYLKYLDENPADYDRLVRDLSDLQHLLVDANSVEQFEFQTRPFEFLEKLTTNQVRWLIDDEAIKIKALVLSQLSSQQASSLMATFEPEVQAMLATEIVQFESMPMAAFNEVATSLAVKAQTVPDYKTVKSDGNQILVNLLDSMNMSQQEGLLAQLKQSSPDSYIELRKVYYIFEDLVNTPKNVVSNVLRTIDGETLAIAFADIEEADLTRLLSCLPDRFAAMVQSEIERMATITTEQRFAAKQQVVDAMRVALANNQFHMSDLEQAA
ncbi:FliG C-terminal domain-containing protein [Vibrio sp. SCSIO 43136]|uniref:FliG C-terminal domain-containing protein n=1 Tax=Vibrio sp. SCSIO 43136 TaxID=2819101 RepID=UPI0020765F62|nr:FliG C-terminal domain-containing protein [Vibrio sp. SCSIO 43136]USD67921.1 hypothetical protein J4N39_17205 [Vibrio sp. SCSIO 43136]